ncbi:S-layer homology domain-containing protein [Cohnella rhizosphaerae]|uniref:S-layer homology domain-containing protein n=1 Tax=Cohnella rhizosphaerae TaxID=1457232 RepID=A0A9X4KVM9_9BACL|nr:S-layer homology domain-containing protein [Cohnella rhizosphaerae]MDG0811757.1 S-layer homology domain-containing protein [Cohnella rhizosphaerae]
MKKTKQALSALAAGAVLLAALGGSATAAGSAAEEKLKALIDAGIISGDLKGNLNLGDNITRAQLAVIMVRAFGLETEAKPPVQTASFTDVAPGSWYSGYIAAAKNLIEDNGYTLGTGGGKFNPNGNVTSAEAVALLCKFLDIKPDSSTSDWASAYVKAALEKGILDANSAKGISKTKPATRETVFTYANTAFGKVKDEDGKTIFDKLKEGVGSGVYNKKRERHRAVMFVTPGSSSA